jgi:hypothetical protein
MQTVSGLNTKIHPFRRNFLNVSKGLFTSRKKSQPIDSIDIVDDDKDECLVAMRVDSGYS